MEMKSESKTRGGLYWGKFALLHIILALIIYYFIFGALTVSLVIEGIRAALSLDRPFSGEKIIAGMGALAIVWWRVRSKITGCGEHKVSVISKRRKLASLLLIFLVPAFFVFIFFVPDRGAILHPEIERAMEKVVVENGYCGKSRVYVQSWRTSCTKAARAMIGGDLIAGGRELTVYGVSDPNVLDRIKQAYVTAFLKTPELKHVIVYFDPNPPSQAQSESKDSFIEMRRE
jgi:hypothetical protein